MDAKSEASKMLEEALLQMDGIITKQQGIGSDQQSQSSITMNPPPQLNGSCNERSIISNANVLSTAKTLSLALQQVSALLH